TFWGSIDDDGRRICCDGYLCNLIDLGHRAAVRLHTGCARSVPEAIGNHARRYQKAQRSGVQGDRRQEVATVTREQGYLYRTGGSKNGGSTVVGMPADMGALTALCRGSRSPHHCEDWFINGINRNFQPHRIQSQSIAVL